MFNPRRPGEPWWAVSTVLLRDQTPEEDVRCALTVAPTAVRCHDAHTAAHTAALIPPAAADQEIQGHRGLLQHAETIAGIKAAII